MSLRKAIKLSQKKHGKCVTRRCEVSQRCAYDYRVTLYKNVRILVYMYFLVDCLDECYLVVWEEENSVSVASPSNVAKGNGADVGECCDVVYKRKNYLGRVAAKGSNY